MRNRLVRYAASAVLYYLSVVPVHAQDSTTLSLAALQDSAAAHDPRMRQMTLLARQSELRRRNVAGELLPAVAIESHAQYQSDVARVPLPGAPTPPHDTYDARVILTQRLFDPSLGARRDLERAQLAHSQATVRSTLYATRQQVNDAFFGALRAQAQGDELRTSITSIEAQVVVAAARVQEGAALPSEELALRAELLRRRQLVVEADIQREAALHALASLTGIMVDSSTRLIVPDLGTEIRRVDAMDVERSERARPEYAQFERSREMLREQERVRAAQDLPRASAFGRAGYGQPGLNPLNDSFDSYWLAGLQVQWAPWTWGASRRDREVLAAQREIIATEEAAFTEHLRRIATQDRAAVERLEAAVRLDDEIIAARTQIAEETRVRYEEAAVTSAEFVERQSQLLSARLTRALHRVELAQARARLLTTLGIEFR
jgi:outer membrane protein TolC